MGVERSYEQKTIPLTFARELEYHFVHPEIVSLVRLVFSISGQAERGVISDAEIEKVIRAEVCSWCAGLAPFPGRPAGDHGNSDDLKTAQHNSGSA